MGNEVLIHKLPRRRNSSEVFFALDDGYGLIMIAVPMRFLNSFAEIRMEQRTVRI